MGKSLDDIVIKPSHHENNTKQNQCSSRSSALEVALKCVINEADHRIKSACIVGRTHIFTENTDDAGVFLKTADKAGDNNVCQHGGQQRYGDSGKYTGTGGAVDLGSIVVLLVDALQATQQNKDLKGQGIPNNIDDHNNDVCAVAGTCIDPVDGFTAKKLNDVVNNAPGICIAAFGTEADDVKHSGQHHADGDGVGDIGQEEDGLQKLLQRLDGVERHGDQQCQHSGDGHCGNTQTDCIGQTPQESLVLDNSQEVAETKLKGCAADFLQTAVVFQKCHTQGVNNGPGGKYQQQDDRRRKV